MNVQNFSGINLLEGAEIMPSAWIEQEEKRAADEALKEAVGACREAGITYIARTERGGVAETIDRVARDERVQHIFMGTRGLGGVRGLLLGSVATQLLHLVDVPVTLVK
jgi:nucleotide-binding universal stress UspA family protein